MVLPPTVDGTICRDEAGLSVHVTNKSDREPELRVLFMRTSDKIIYRAKKRNATFASKVVLSLHLLIRDEKLRSKCSSFKFVLIIVPSRVLFCPCSSRICFLPTSRLYYCWSFFCTYVSPHVTSLQLLIWTSNHTEGHYTSLSALVSRP